MANIVVSEVVAGDPGLGFKISLAGVSQYNPNGQLTIRTEVHDTVGGDSEHTSIIVTNKEIDQTEPLVVVLPFGCLNYELNNELNVTIYVRQQGIDLPGSPHVQNSLAAQDGVFDYDVAVINN